MEKILSYFYRKITSITMKLERDFSLENENEANFPWPISALTFLPFILSLEVTLERFYLPVETVYWSFEFACLFSFMTVFHEKGTFISELSQKVILYIIHGI